MSAGPEDGRPDMLPSGPALSVRPDLTSHVLLMPASYKVDSILLTSLVSGIRSTSIWNIDRLGTACSLAHAMCDSQFLTHGAYFILTNAR